MDKNNVEKKNENYKKYTTIMMMVNTGLSVIAILLLLFKNFCGC